MGSLWPRRMKCCWDLFFRKLCLGSDGYPVPLTSLFNESQVDFVRTNNNHSQYPPPRPAIKGKFLERSGWKWWTHQKSLCLGHADSMSCCPEATPPSWTCGRSLGLCFQSFIRPLFLFSLRGSDSALLEKWLGEVLHQNSVIAENKHLLPPLSSLTV